MKLVYIDHCNGCGEKNVLAKEELCLRCYVMGKRNEEIIEIKRKKAIAEKWLKEEHSPEIYQEGKRKYNQICDKLDEYSKVTVKR